MSDFTMSNVSIDQRSTRAAVARIAALAGATSLIILAVAGPAVAHVTANPRTAEQGSYTKVSFRVPNERDNAGTSRVEIDLPLDHPITSVSVRPTPGWTVTVTKSKLPKPIKVHDSEVTEATSKIVWTKGRIEPGQFQEFDVSMGPLPTDTDSLVFKAVQTYSNGEAVHWDQVESPGGERPEHPAPTLQLTKPAGGPSGASPAAGTGGASSAGVAPGAGGGQGAGSDDGTARLLAGLGLAAGVAGIGVGGLGLARGRGRS